MARSRFRRRIRSTLAALACALVFPSGEFVLLAQQDKPPAPPAGEDKPAKPPEPPAKEGAAAEKPAVPPDTTKKEPGAEQPPKITNDQLDALVAPIALYPDSLLAQVLVASTYPLEIVQLHQWLEKNKAQKEKALKDKALVDAVAKQPWDPSIQSMAALPDVVKRLADDVQWTTDLGNAFLSQQSDVMDAVQRMRKKAQDKGALKSNEQQKVSEEKAGEPPKTVIIVESANPEVVYVPSYSPTVVYGAAVYPYPPIYYPPYPPGAAFMSFSIGVMWGAAIWGGSCCGCGWGGGDVDINVNNNFNRNSNINTGDIGSGNRGQASPKGGSGAGGTGGRGGASAGTSDRPGGGAGAGGGGQKWSHNPQHRGGTPYSDKATASKYGGNARGQGNAGNKAVGGGASAGTRPSTGMGGTGAGPGGSAGRPGGGSGAGPSAGTSDLRGGGGGAGGAGGDRIGSRDIPSSGSRGGSGGSRGGGFGSGGGYSGGSARSSSSRGASSMGGRSFGGGGGGRRR
jgi:hypothetical protein